LDTLTEMLSGGLERERHTESDIDPLAQDELAGDLATTVAAIQIPTTALAEKILLARKMTAS